MNELKNVIERLADTSKQLSTNGFIATAAINISSRGVTVSVISGNSYIEYTQSYEPGGTTKKIIKLATEACDFMDKHPLK